jgi:acyl dehydratase
MLDFARLYDNIPLHTDEEYAKATPFGGLIAPGVMSFMCVWAKFLEKGLFKDALIAGKSTKIEWTKPVYPGDILTGEAVISALTPRNAKNGLVAVTITAKNQKGEVVLYNETESVIKKRPL